MEGDWDFVIVGAGSAGCVLAERLSADPRHRVLLLEAGPPARGLRYQVPVLGAMESGNSRSDWVFRARPDPTRHGIEDVYSRGRVVGGSGSINATVYVRGNRSDYDLWRDQGATGWGYDDLIPHFRAIEGAHPDLPDLYGRDGPLKIMATHRPHAIAQAFVEAVAEIGYPQNPGYNGGDQAGASITHVNQAKGRRCSSAVAFLGRALKRPNLRLVTGALARRVMFDVRRARGVEYQVGDSVRQATARREVILCAGPVNTPKLLMLSGVGDARALAGMGIAPRHDNPAVGGNLQDHCGLLMRAHVNRRTINMDYNLWGRIRHGLEYAIWRGGAATYVSPAVAFVKTLPDLAQPDVEFHFTPIGAQGYGASMAMMDTPAITIHPFINRPFGRGRVTLASARPEDAPVIDLPMLGDERDMAALIAAGRIGRTILGTRALGRFGAVEFAPGNDVRSDDEWRDYARMATVPCYHISGSCRMGTDDQAVVAPDLKVRGVDRLRVADSSIIPELPNANINAISMVIGAKAAIAVLAGASAGE